MHPHISYTIAQQRSDELQRVGERERLAREVHASQPTPRGSQPLSGLTERFARLRSRLAPADPSRL